MKGRYYCEMESPIYRQIIAEKLKLEKKVNKLTKKGKRKNAQRKIICIPNSISI